MSNFATANTVANEIVKAVDFSFAHDQAINNATLGIQTIMANEGNDFIIGGKVKPYPSGGMNFIISPIYGHCAGSGIDFIETLTSQNPISIEDADPVHDRIDTIQVRGVAGFYDHQDREFRDPVSGIKAIEYIPTKKRIYMEVSVKKGSFGSVTAPSADVGYIKLAEIHVPAASVSVDAENIKNITARHTGAENVNWTMDRTRTFNLGYLADIVATILAEHNEDGTHRNVINAANIIFGNSNNAVRGLIIPTGESINVMGVDFNALAGITQVLAAIAEAVNLAYSYTNNLLSRYTLLSAYPVAASTGNVNITTGGELAIDGIACTVGQMVFLKDQTNPVENGLWEVQTGAWNRYAGFRVENANVFTQKLLLIKKGTANGGKIFYLDGDSYRVGTSQLNFKESLLSPVALPGTIVFRDNAGKTDYDEKIAKSSGALKLEITSNADMVPELGRNLFDVLGVNSIPAAMAEIRRRCNNNGEIDNTKIPDFRGLMVGDYLDGLDFSGITPPTAAQAPNGGPQAWNDTYKNNRIVIAGFNTYKGVGDTENASNHVLFIFRNVLWRQRQRATDSNTGGYAYNNAANEIRAYLEGLAGDGNGTFAIKLEECLNGGMLPPGGKYLYTIRKLHSKKHGTTWVDPVWNSYTAWLPTELEVFGYETFGDEAGAACAGKGIGQYNTNVQFPIYQKGYAYRIKRYNGSRAWWWEQTPDASYSAGFCGVTDYGYAHGNNASYTDGGVSPAFCVR
jgi:hypothetical protein